MNLKWDKNYTLIAIYSFLVLSGVVAVYYTINNIPHIFAYIRKIIGVLSPFIYGFSFAYILNPLLKFCEEKLLYKIESKRLRRILGITLTYLITITLIVGFGLVVLPRMITSLYSLVGNISGYMNLLQIRALDIIEKYNADFLQIDIDSFIADTIQSLSAALQKLLPQFLTLLTGITSVALDVVMGIIVSIYMLQGKEKFFAKIKRALHAFISPGKIEAIVEVTRDSHLKFSGFISGKILDSAIIGVLCFIGMSIFKMPNAVLVSFIVGVTNMIPYFGPFIGAIPGFILVLIVSPIKSFYFLIFILVLQQFDGNILGPKILGESTGLSPIWVIFAIVLFGSEMGVLGMFIGVPLFAVIYSLIESMVQFRLNKKGLSTDVGDYASSKHKIID